MHDKYISDILLQNEYFWYFKYILLILFALLLK